VFRGVSPAHLKELAEHARPRSFARASTMMAQGSVSESMHLLVSGQARVERAIGDPPTIVHLADLGPGEVVGEMGVLEDRPRSATVAALEDLETLELKADFLKKVFQEDNDVLLAIMRLVTQRWRNIDELVEQTLKITQAQLSRADEPAPADPTQAAVALRAFLRSPVFNHAQLAHLKEIAQHAQPRSFKKGEILMRQGATSESMDLIVSGRVKVERAVERIKKPLHVAELGPLDVVGEMGVLENRPRSATITALTGVDTFEVKAGFLKQLFQQDSEVLLAIMRVVTQRWKDIDELVEVSVKIALAQFGQERA